MGQSSRRSRSATTEEQDGQRAIVRAQVLDAQRVPSRRKPRDFHVAAEQLEMAAELGDVAAPDFIAVEKQAARRPSSQVPRTGRRGLGPANRSSLPPTGPPVPQNDVQAVGDGGRVVRDLNAGWRRDDCLRWRARSIRATTGGLRASPGRTVTTTSVRRLWLWRDASRGAPRRLRPGVAERCSQVGGATRQPGSRRQVLRPKSKGAGILHHAQRQTAVHLLPGVEPFIPWTHRIVEDMELVTVDPVVGGASSTE